MKISIDVMSGVSVLLAMVLASIYILNKYPSIDLIQLDFDTSKIEEKINYSLFYDSSSKLKSLVQIYPSKKSIASTEISPDIRRKINPSSMLSPLETLESDDLIIFSSLKKAISMIANKIQENLFEWAIS